MTCDVGTILYRVLWRRDPRVPEAIPCEVIEVIPAASDGFYRHGGYIRYTDERGGARAYIVHDEDDRAIAVTSGRGARLYASEVIALFEARREVAERWESAKRDAATLEHQVIDLTHSLRAAQSASAGGDAMSTDLYSGERIPLGSMADVRAKAREEGCRWYQWIGGRGCDACGQPARAHRGDLRSAQDTPFGADEWVGMVWSADFLCSVGGAR